MRLWARIRAWTPWAQIAAAVGLVAAVVSAVFGVLAWLDGRTSSDRGPLVTMDQPQGGMIDRCAVFTGTIGDVGTRVLWLAHTSGGNTYFFVKPSLEPGGRWQAEDTVGPENPPPDANYQVIALIVEQDTSSFLDGLTGRSTNGDRGYWSAKTLPPGADEQLRLSAPRSSGSSAACGEVAPAGN